MLILEIFSFDEEKELIMLQRSLLVKAQLAVKIGVKVHY